MEKEKTREKVLQSLLQENEKPHSVFGLVKSLSLRWLLMDSVFVQHANRIYDLDKQIAIHPSPRDLHNKRRDATRKAPLAICSLDT